MKNIPNLNKVKFKKLHKVNKRFLFSLENKSFFLLFGQFGIQALESGKITFKQIEACRRTIRRGITKTGSLWIRIFTYAPVSKKSSASRMGKGKGLTSYWISPIKKGQILFEINYLSFKKALIILEKASSKLPIKTKIIFSKF